MKNRNISGDPKDLGAADPSRLEVGEGSVGLRERVLLHLGTERDLREKTKI